MATRLRQAERAPDGAYPERSPGIMEMEEDIECLFDRAIHFLVVEDVGHFTQLSDKDVTTNLREGFLKAVHELQHEARHVRHRR